MSIKTKITPEPLIIIAGPTATGKTAAAAELCLQLGGEVISADSMQIYKYMDIGTAKPGDAEKRGVPHHLMDELYPDEAYSAYAFKSRAEALISDIRSRDKRPVICGGTGFYINALVNETDFVPMPADEAYRAELYALEPDVLVSMLKECDPVSADQIHPNNIKRLVRALEFYKQTGQAISAHNARERGKAGQSHARFAILTMERSALYDRINKRVDDMVAAGLEHETRALLARGYAQGLVSMQGIGYKEMIRYIRGEYSLDDAVDAIKTGTRRYAKRQWTWFSRQLTNADCSWYNVDDFNGPKDLAARIARDMAVT